MFELFKKKKKEYSLLVDMGGTNIRLGLTRNGRTFEQTTILKAAEFKSFDEALAFYLKQTKEKPGHLLMAAAGALYNDTISLSNNPWIISKKEIQRRFSFQKVTLINDFVAQALAVPLIPEEKKIQITDRGEVQKKAAILVIGPGTGLGVSALVPNENAPGGFFPVPPLQRAGSAAVSYLNHVVSESPFQLFVGGVEHAFLNLQPFSELSVEVGRLLFVVVYPVGCQFALESDAVVVEHPVGVTVSGSVDGCSLGILVFLGGAQKHLGVHARRILLVGLFRRQGDCERFLSVGRPSPEALGGRRRLLNRS